MFLLLHPIKKFPFTYCRYLIQKVGYWIPSLPSSINFKEIPFLRAIHIPMNFLGITTKIFPTLPHIFLSWTNLPDPCDMGLQCIVLCNQYAA